MRKGKGPSKAVALHTGGRARSTSRFSVSVSANVDRTAGDLGRPSAREQYRRCIGRNVLGETRTLRCVGRNVLSERGRYQSYDAGAICDAISENGEVGLPWYFGPRTRVR